MAKITRRPKSEERETIVVRTQPKKNDQRVGAWWKGKDKKEIADLILGTVSFLKDQNNYRYKQASIYSRLYGNLPLVGITGTNLSKINTSNQLPMDRPTMSVITSCVDTLVSRITQSKPRPIFLTDAGDYKQRTLAKQMNGFIQGELYQTRAYELGPLFLRDALVLGTGVLKIVRDVENRVALERRLCTEILVDPNDSLYGDPRQLYEVQLVDRSVLMEAFPKCEGMISRAENAYPDSSGSTDKTVSDQVMVVEGWHLSSGPGAKDGKHVIACSEGILNPDDMNWDKKKFPFIFLHFSPRMLGFFGQGLAEQLMGTQVEVNKLLITISRSINLVGVPRIFVEDGSKVVSSHFNNEIGGIVKYRGTKPIFETAQCIAPEIYAQLQRLVEYAYQQSGISTLTAGGKKPAGLNSGASIREYDDLQTDRFAALEKRYDQAYIDLAYQITDEAISIAEDEGSYQTVYPNKDGTKQIDLPEIKKLKDDPFIIQCFDSSSLPRDPAGRMAKITEWVQSGMYTPQEGRRLMGLADTEQQDRLLNAAEERILKQLDDIIENGKYTPPDPFTDLSKAKELVVQYYNLFSQFKLEEEKLQMIRDYFAQLNALVAQATPPPPAPGMNPQASPEPLPQSPLIPNVPPGGQQVA